MNTKNRLLLMLLFFMAWNPASACRVTAQEKKVDQEHARKMAIGLRLFLNEVKPVLIGRCVKCHGGDSIEGELDLTSRKSLMAGGQSGQAILIGKSSSSRLVQMISHELEPAMPEGGAKLDQRNIDSIARWIDLGAPYDGPLIESSSDPLAWTKKTIDPSRRSFWSFQPLKNVTVPVIDDDSWSKTDVDRFVLREMRAKGIKPNPAIDRARLVRRMYFDVVGLPPTPDQVEVLLKDGRGDAIDRLINELLSSDHFGEKWARHWLDVVRFAESHGFEQDYNRPHAYHYRDFVIKAMNSDLPYDQFLQWQIAGDEIAPDNPIALMATGFLGAGVFPTQLTEKEFESARYDELDDMAATIGTSMLGLTLGCARCHDHKFDPIPQRDYYQFISTFSSTIRSEVDLELDPASIKKKMTAWEQENQKLIKNLEDHEEKKVRPAFGKWLKSRPEIESFRPGWVVLDFSKAVSRGGATFRKMGDGSLLATGANPDFDSYEFITSTQLKGVSAIKVEALSDPSLVKKGPGRASNGNFALGDLEVLVRNQGEEAFERVKLVRARATFEQNQANLSVAASIDDNPKTGWAVDPQFGKNQAAIFEFEKPIGEKGEIELTIKMRFDVNHRHSIGRPRISITNTKEPVGFEGNPQRQAVVEIFQILENSDRELDDSQRKTLFRWYCQLDAGWAKLNERLLIHVSKKPRPEKTRVMVSSEGLKPLKHNADGRKFPHFYKQTYFLKRGDASQKQGIAKPGVIQVLSRNKSFADYMVEPKVESRLSYRRTALVNWLTDTKNGSGEQVARVVVNRIWQQYFGRGIVATTNDFGFQGSRPTHPELLDWLARKLIDEKWSLKSIHRIILCSAVYQQSSAFDETSSAVDLNNELLWRYSPKRLDAEIIRDSILAVSDSLNRTMFGPGSLDEKMNRRSIYFTIKRSKLVPMMQIFDSPEPLVSVGVRPRTTIAPQALLLMNNQNVRDYARAFARKIALPGDRVTEPQSLRGIVDRGFRVALGRPASEAELNSNVDFLRKQVASYDAEKKTDALAWATSDFCQVLFCLNEFVYVD